MQNKIYMLCGKSGCGKSWFGRYILLEYLKQRATKYIVILDNSSDHFYSGLRGKNFYLQEYGQVEAQGSYNWGEFIRVNKKVIIETTNLTEEETTALVDNVSKAIYNLGDVLFLIDEAHIFFPTFRSSVELGRLLRGGRKQGIDIILITQTMIDLNLIALRLTNILILFQITEINEIARAQQYFGVDKQILSNLRDREYLFKNMKTSQEFMDTTNDLKL